MIRDDSGQWLLLTGVVVAIGLVILLVFLNQSVIAGHSSSESIMDFPKNDIRELRAETVNEAYLIGRSVNDNGDEIGLKEAKFRSSFDKYFRDTKDLYGRRGCDIFLEYSPGINLSAPPSGKLDNVTLFINYNNGETRFNETATVILR